MDGSPIVDGRARDCLRAGEAPSPKGCAARLAVVVLAVEGVVFAMVLVELGVATTIWAGRVAGVAMADTAAINAVERGVDWLLVAVKDPLASRWACATACLRLASRNSSLEGRYTTVMK